MARLKTFSQRRQKEQAHPRDVELMDEVTELREAKTEAQKAVRRLSREVAELRKLLGQSADICIMRQRYARGELSWANTLNTYDAAVEAQVCGASCSKLSL